MSINKIERLLKETDNSREYAIVLKYGHTTRYDEDWPLPYHPSNYRRSRNDWYKRKLVYSTQVRMFKTWKHNRKRQWKNQKATDTFIGLPNEIYKPKLIMKNKPENGVYILYNEKLFTITDWKQQSDPTIADYVVLVTDYGAMKIRKKIKGKMKWEEAMRFDLPDSTQGSQIIFNRIAIKEAILFIGGEWVGDWFWTSVEYGPLSAWIYNGNGGDMGATSKYITGYVRSVTTFQLPASDFKPIDKVTPDLLDVGLRAAGIKIDKRFLGRIIGIFKLIEEKGGEASLDDIAKFQEMMKKRDANIQRGREYGVSHAHDLIESQIKPSEERTENIELKKTETKFKPKDGDFVAWDSEGDFGDEIDHCIAIVHGEGKWRNVIDNEELDIHAILNPDNIAFVCKSVRSFPFNFRPATDTEIMQLVSALEKTDKTWNFYKKCIEDLKCKPSEDKGASLGVSKDRVEPWQPSEVLKQKMIALFDDNFDFDTPAMSRKRFIEIIPEIAKLLPFSLGGENSIIPILTGKDAENFIKKAEESYKNRGSIDFSEQIKINKKILSKSKNKLNEDQ